jgi:hypothetical protein
VALPGRVQASALSGRATAHSSLPALLAGMGNRKVTQPTARRRDLSQNGYGPHTHIFTFACLRKPVEATGLQEGRVAYDLACLKRRRLRGRGEGSRSGTSRTGAPGLASPAAVPSSTLVLTRYLFLGGGPVPKFPISGLGFAGSLIWSSLFVGNLSPLSGPPGCSGRPFCLIRRLLVGCWCPVQGLSNFHPNCGHWWQRHVPCQ